jgi:hypothetical protein
MAEDKKKAAEQAEEVRSGETQGVSMESILKMMEEMNKELQETKKELKAAKEEAGKASEKADEAKKEKELTEGQKKALMERRFHIAMEQAKQEKVEIFLPVDRRSEDQDVFVSVNGYDYLIKRGEKVMVPVFVVKALDLSEKQKTDAFMHMKGLQDKAEAKELN